MLFDEFNLSCYISAPQERVLNAWTQSGELEKWFLKKADFISSDDSPRPKGNKCVSGDTYWFEWADKTVETGTIHEVSSNGLSFSFGAGVDVEVHVEIGTRTLVTLKQTQRADSMDRQQQIYVSCYQGWTFYLANLKSVLECGNDLREFEPDRSDLVNV